MLKLSELGTISEEDIERVYNIRHHPKSAPGFEKEVTEQSFDIEDEKERQVSWDDVQSLFS